MKISTFAEANHYLRRYVPSNKQVNYNLDTMRQLMKALGDPQETYQVIHVAGTSGKTSTTYYVASLLRQTGKRVGHTVSPHIDNLGERVQVDLQPLDEKLYCARLTEFLEILNKLSITPSYFELLVAFAFWEFARQKVDYAVMEVGLGGRLDATNVVSNPNKIGVITDIGFDHMRILGDTLPKIAAEKAGIAQTGNQVFMLEQNQSVVKSIQATVEARGGQLHILQPQTVTYPNLVLFQQRNWSLAKQVVDYVLERNREIALTADQAKQSTQITIPARMEQVTFQGKQLILDGSHNEQKIASLVAAFQVKYPKQKAAVLISLVQDKQSVLEEALKSLLPITDSLLITEFHGQQDLPKKSLPAEEIKKVAEKASFTNIEIELQPEKALQLLMQKDTKLHLVTGSLYLLNHIRPSVFRD